MSENEAPGHGQIWIDGEKLKLAAKKRDMTLATLADAMGMHYNGILRIVTKGSTNLGTLTELCNVLDCNPLDLLVWDGYPKIDPNSDALATHLLRLGIEVPQVAVAN